MNVKMWKCVAASRECKNEIHILLHFKPNLEITLNAFPHFHTDPTKLGTFTHYLET